MLASNNNSKWFNCLNHICLNIPAFIFLLGLIQFYQGWGNTANYELMSSHSTSVTNIISRFPRKHLALVTIFLNRLPLSDPIIILPSIATSVSIIYVDISTRTTTSTAPTNPTFGFVLTTSKNQPIVLMELACASSTASDLEGRIS